METNLKYLNQNLTKIDEKLKSEDEWSNAKTTEFNSLYKNSVLYEDHKKSIWNEKESVIMWIVFIVFYLMVVFIVWFSKKKPLV